MVEFLGTERYQLGFYREQGVIKQSRKEMGKGWTSVLDAQKGQCKSSCRERPSGYGPERQAVLISDGKWVGAGGSKKLSFGEFTFKLAVLYTQGNLRDTGQGL